MNLLQIPTVPVTLPDSIPTPREELQMLSSLPFDELIDKLVKGVVTFTINLALAILVFYVGKLIISKLTMLTGNIMLRRNVDRSLTTFILSMVRIVLYFILIVTVIGILGIETSSFIAIFASAGVAIGMALSGTLQNFAGGVLILLLKPYKIGDYIEAQGYAGYVREIQIFHTIIHTADNKAIIIPNGGLSTGSINNWSREDYRRIDWPVGISYGDSVDVARAKILEIIKSDHRIVEKFIEDDRIRRYKEQKERLQAQLFEEVNGLPARNPGLWKRLFTKRHKRKIDLPSMTAPRTMASILTAKKDCSPTVHVKELADSSVILKVSAWTQTTDYWDVFYAINERISTALPTSGVSVPFPQMDVHLDHTEAQNTTT